MGFSLGLRPWGDLDDGIVRELRAFATAHGTHDDDELEDAWWRPAAASSSSRYALDDRYGSATAYALEYVLDEVLKLRTWKSSHPGIRTDWLMVPPFSFCDSYEGKPAFWARVTTESLALMVGEPMLLLQTWKGAFDAKYRDAGQRAFSELAECKVGDDDDRAVRGVEYALYELVREGWAHRLPVVISW